MLSINKKIIQNIKSPNFIIFNNLIRVNFLDVNDELKHKITFFEKDVKKSMLYQEVDELFKKYKRDTDLKDYKNMADNHTTDFIRNLNKFPANIKKNIINDFSENTYFSRYYEDLNMTSLMRKYKVQPYELFNMLVHPYYDFYNTSSFYIEYE